MGHFIAVDVDVPAQEPLPSCLDLLGSVQPWSFDLQEWQARKQLHVRLAGSRSGTR